MACCPHYPPKTNEGAESTGISAEPAVHTIPQKLKHFPHLQDKYLSLLSTLSPKNLFCVWWSLWCCGACCPHYPPKTFAISDHRQKKLACCPHYPPKTSRWARTFASNKTACCPHYPPKTPTHLEPILLAAVPAVHTIPQKLSQDRGDKSLHARLLSTLSPKNGLCAGFLRRWVQPAVHTIPQKPLSCNTLNSHEICLLSTLSPKNLDEKLQNDDVSMACCPHYPPKTTRINRVN